ncbi:hypothetical protein [Dongia rigui]|uniref:Uncharacterized protein n=1 Tax=Dongia rigui TaxID=940149 RepID=A0ABU5DY29_9PROT|nr:hypothetical protein [Dongia rigui]MDY0872175.1 hypothetical protein [Dongia rigui]
MGQALLSFGRKINGWLYHLGGWILGIIIFLAVSDALQNQQWLGDTMIMVVSLSCASLVCGIIHSFVERRQLRQRNERFISALKEPQWPVDVVSNEATAFRRDWFALMWVPVAGVSLPVDNSALRITTLGLEYDVSIPIQLIMQVEFDPGDGPPGRRHPGMSWRRQWFGLPYAPTVYLGLRLAPAEEIFVYPLCFDPKNEEDARVLYQRLLDGRRAASHSISLPLEMKISEEALPGSFESRYLRPSILQRFWPDYRPKTVREWLNR